MKVELSKDQLENLVDFIELEFIPYVRKYEDIDNMEYIACMADAYRVLKTAVVACNGISDRSELSTK